jgi:hypothetical protein
MAERKAFLLRIDKQVLDAVHRWADDDLRSLNAQIEFLLRRALQTAHRLGPGAAGAAQGSGGGAAARGRAPSE